MTDPDTPIANDELVNQPVTPSEPATPAPHPALPHVDALRGILDKLEAAGTHIADVGHWVTAARSVLAEIEHTL